MSGLSKSSLRTLIGNTLGGGLVVIGAAGTIETPKPAIVIAGVSETRPLVVVGRLPAVEELPPQPWLQPGIPVKPPPPPPPPHPKPRPRPQTQSGGGGAGDFASNCPPEPLYCKPIAERRLREIFEKIDAPVEAPIELWKSQPDREPYAEEWFEKDEKKKPEFVIVEVPVRVEVPVPVFVPVFVTASDPSEPTAVSTNRYITFSKIWPPLLVASALAITVVVVTEISDSASHKISKRKRRY